MYLKDLLRVSSEYILSDDQVFCEEDLMIARSLILNAEQEMAIFRGTGEYMQLREIFEGNFQINSVFINSYGIHHRDFDEMSFSIGGHPTATLLPILLTYHKERETKVFLQALKLELGLGQILNPELYQGQYHPTTIIGLLGATALAAKLLELTHKQLVNAFGIAFSFLSGIKGNFGSSAKCLQVAHATQHGLLSAMYSQKGFTANIDLLEQNDTLQIFTGKNLRASHVRWLCKMLTEHLTLKEEFLFKKYDVCGSFHGVIDIALDDRTAFQQPIECITKVTLSMHPQRLAHKSIGSPNSSEQKRFSPNYLYAYTFLGNNLTEISSSNNVSEEVVALMEKVEVRADSTLGKWEYKTEIQRRTC